jgi:hypothetical protein
MNIIEINGLIFLQRLKLPESDGNLKRRTESELRAKHGNIKLYLYENKLEIIHALFENKQKVIPKTYRLF